MKFAEFLGSHSAIMIHGFTVHLQSTDKPTGKTGGTGKKKKVGRVGKGGMAKYL